MPGQDDVSYGRAARIRVAVADLAREITDSGRGLAPTYADSHACGGEFIQTVAQVADEGRLLLSYAVAYERTRGVSWEIIGNTLGVTGRPAHERFATDVEQLQDDLAECWLFDGERGGRGCLRVPLTPAG